MNKSDLVLKVSENAEISQRAANELIDVVLDSMVEGLSEDGTVTLRGFGCLKLVEAAERTGRNIRTGEAIKIPARTRIKFTPYLQIED